MYTLINGSPKYINSNSLYFLNIISKYLDKSPIFNLKNDDYEKIITSIKNSHTIVLAFPLYVDSPTSITLEFMDYLFDNEINLKNKKIFVIINCGFREGQQNITALNIVKNWCLKMNVIYKGAILIGAGEIVGKRKYKLVSKKALKNLFYFGSAISNDKNTGDIITTMDYLDNKTYVFLANRNWNKKSKANGLTLELVRKK